MKQVVQDLRSGATAVLQVPTPAVGRGQLLVRSTNSLISAGTERMLVEFGRGGWLEKARQQPDKVRMVLNKVRSDGLLATLESVRRKLDQPLVMGYCNVGTVVGIGPDVSGFRLGERVASNGPHAELITVPVNLCARVPDGVDDEQAAFTVLGAIALQGIRLAQPALGEVVVVMGLGLIGLMTVQMLRAQGCRVLGIDLDPARLQLARRFGATVVDAHAGEDPVAGAMAFSRDRGADAVLVTASTRSSEPIQQAARMSRQRGRIVLVGVTGLELSRADFYEKELTFQVSCSYGPGRYDSAYEQGGHDYPVGFVRWTEQRNFEAVLDLLASGAIDLRPLITHRFEIAEAAQAYELLASEAPSLGIIINYGAEGGGAVPQAASRTLPLPGSTPAEQRGAPAVAFIGAGNYASGVLMPMFKAAGAGLHTVVTLGGVSAVHHGAAHGFARASTDVQCALEDPAIAAIVIATRHGSHAELATRALRAGKHVFVEKPLCLTLEELQMVQSAGCDAGTVLMIGFNRRYAPHVQRMSQLLAAVSGPKAFVMTVNAGAVPARHWTQDPQSGGGRLVGEACHFVDLLRFLAGAPIASSAVATLGGPTRDSATVTLTFADGSLGSIHYLANGNRAFPKERLEVFAGGRVLQLDNFRRLRGFGWPGFHVMRTWRQDKGQRACVDAFVAATRSGGPPPIGLNEILEVSRVSIEIQRAAQ